MAEFEDRSCTCDCGAREANTALHQRLAVLEAERDRLRAERDVLIGLCIHEVPPEYPRCPRYTHWSYEGASRDEDDEVTEWESLWVARDSRAEAVAAVRRAAGLPPEPELTEER